MAADNNTCSKGRIMNEYGTTKAIGQFVAAMGWVVVALGIILLLVAFSTLNTGYGLFALAPAIGVMLGGLLLVSQGQLTQAFVDTAVNTGKLVQILGASNQAGLTNNMGQA